mmetsp:Transcript_9056/g.21788  ORF Transcript_9056/g.21788 Transcript_9056/m.21788 type:complete len:342 (+) Transcript_9056:1005-2030(+)
MGPHDARVRGGQAAHARVTEEDGQADQDAPRDDRRPRATRRAHPLCATSSVALPTARRARRCGGAATRRAQRHVARRALFAARRGDSACARRRHAGRGSTDLALQPRLRRDDRLQPRGGRRQELPLPAGRAHRAARAQPADHGRAAAQATDDHDHQRAKGRLGLPQQPLAPPGARVEWRVPLLPGGPLRLHDPPAERPARAAAQGDADRIRRAAAAAARRALRRRRPDRAVEGVPAVDGQARTAAMGHRPQRRAAKAPLSAAAAQLSSGRVGARLPRQEGARRRRALRARAQGARRRAVGAAQGADRPVRAAWCGRHGAGGTGRLMAAEADRQVMAARAEQ